MIRAELRIDLAALLANYRLLAARAAGAQCVAMLKADAYGLGMAAVAPALAEAGCDTFFVATPEEGRTLRTILREADIYVLNGYQPALREVFRAYRLRPVLNTLAEIEVWRDGPAAIYVDTGMNRLGLEAADIDALLAGPAKIGFEVAILMSHLACADEPDHPMNERQLARFRETVARLKALPAFKAAALSLANSAGIFLGPEYHFDLVRPGIALYGGNPFTGRPNPMANVAEVHGRILQIRAIAAGDSVGYGATFTASRPSRIAIVDVGYADGYLRAFSSKGSALIAGQRAPVVGRVSMDFLALDVTDLPADATVVGAAVNLLGGGVSLDEAAAASGLSCYELLTLLGRRYNRVYLGVDRT